MRNEKISFFPVCLPVELFMHRIFTYPCTTDLIFHIREVNRRLQALF